MATKNINHGQTTTAPFLWAF